MTSQLTWPEYLNVYTHFKVDENIILCNDLCVRKVKRAQVCGKFSLLKSQVYHQPMSEMWKQLQVT